MKYSQGFTSGKFEPRETKIYTFKNGKVISIETQYSKDKVIETFEYNAKGKPAKFKYFYRNRQSQVKTFLHLAMIKTENL